MSYKISTGLRDHLATVGSIKAAMDGGVIRIYAGAVPGSANDSVTGNTLLCTVSDDATGDGLNLDAAATDGVVTKDPGQIWRGINVASGTATFFRFSPISDDGTSSTTVKRMHGTIGILTGNLRLANTTLTSGNEQRVETAAFGIPAE